MELLAFVDEGQRGMCERMPDTRMTFARCGLRCTRQRVEVYERLRETRSHPTAEEIHREICGCDCGCQTSLATVYNALDALTRAGLIRRIQTSGGARYDANVDDHLHLTMPDGRVVDVPEDVSSELLAMLPSDALERLSDRLGVAIDHIAIQVVAAPDGARSAGVRV
ncbi:MAG: Fur family transcriptional regulator [Phycisphaerales bacterium]